MISASRLISDVVLILIVTGAGWPLWRTADGTCSLGIGAVTNGSWHDPEFRMTHLRPWFEDAPEWRIV
jgi:hypothetical protein